MAEAQFSMREEEFAAIQIATDTLLDETAARGVFVVDRVGQLISQTGRTAELDTTGLATLAASSIAATGSLAQLLGQEEFPTHFHQGKSGSLHMTLVGERAILIVVFDEKSSLGLVRLRARKASEVLAQVFEIAKKKSEAEAPSNQSGFGKITDEEIDNLFSD
jgi:predicted regulator of Ras-like GTPase activity (Roadblock/LC7/MglB family)